MVLILDSEHVLIVSKNISWQKQFYDDVIKEFDAQKNEKK